MTLPSNSSSQYYPDNTVANFKTRLATPISLSGDWEVAMFEIEYPRTYYNITNQNTLFHYIYKHVGVSRVERFNIPAGFYSSPQELIGVINAHLNLIKNDKKLDKIPVFSYDHITRKVKCKLNHGDRFQFNDGDMSLKLGITGINEPCASTGDIEWQADGTCDLDRENRSIYVYCDILEHVHVGDVRAPLLRIVGTTGKHGDSIRRIFDRPLYVPVQKKEFDTIEIDIRRDTGDLVAFEGGKSAVTLHFRLCKNPYFLK